MEEVRKCGRCDDFQRVCGAWGYCFLNRNMKKVKDSTECLYGFGPYVERRAEILNPTELSQGQTHEVTPVIFDHFRNE